MLTTLALALAFLCPSQPEQIELNQSVIERAAPWLAPAPAEPRQAPDLPTAEQTDFSNPRQVFSFVFARFPDHAVVYPTETYYYYKMPLGPRIVAGNVRLLDAADGKIHIGYFDANQPGDSAAATFTSADGVDIQPVGEGEYRVTADGRTVSFRLFGAEHARPTHLRLLPTERCLSGIMDESGIRFFLNYDQSVHAFWFVLDDHAQQPDTFVPISPQRPEFLVGQRTRFVVYHDQEYDRRILVGVLADSVRRNDYYDGPFDQVPPRLGIRPELQEAYPYTRWRGGIDEHGNFIQQSGSRVAISPYDQYETLPAILERLTHRLDVTPAPSTPAHKWLRLTYESKRDFHRRLIAAGEPIDPEANAAADARSGPPALPTPGLEPLEPWVPAEHEQWTSQGWPANHEKVSSEIWPNRHEQQESRSWPPNHKQPASGWK